MAGQARQLAIITLPPLGLIPLRHRSLSIIRVPHPSRTIRRSLLLPPANMAVRPINLICPALLPSPKPLSRMGIHTPEIPFHHHPPDLLQVNTRHQPSPTTQVKAPAKLHISLLRQRKKPSISSPEAWRTTKQRERMTRVILIEDTSLILVVSEKISRDMETWCAVNWLGKSTSIKTA